MNWSRQALFVLASCLLSSPIASGAQVVRSIRWQEIAAAHELRSGAVVAAPDGIVGSSLRVVHEGAARATFLLLTLEHPGISAARYALRGRVKYDAVTAGSYLEMWSHLPDGAFFSRTLEQGGPMGRLEGSSPWRGFVIPFFNGEGGSPPQKLVMNLVMQGPGTVEIGPLELVQFAANEDPFADATAWWSGRQTGMWGGIAGSVLGILGAVIGWLGSAGHAKGFVLGTLKGIAWTGLGAFLVGAFAALSGQSYAVYYPLLLLGAVGGLLGFTLPSSLRKRYEQLELRRMHALDA